MIHPKPATLEGHGVRLEPMEPQHADALAEATQDGRLWEFWYTSCPEPDKAADYVAKALVGQQEGHMLPWVVRQLSTDRIVGTTRYHDVVPAVDRVEIGWTWYAQSVQGTTVNSACKLLLLEYAFDKVGCEVVGLRTDNFNFRSQAAIAGIGAKRDGVLRHHFIRRDGTVRDSVMFSILKSEWRDVRRHLELRIARKRP